MNRQPYRKETLKKWNRFRGQPNGDGTAAYYSTDGQVWDTKQDTAVDRKVVCVQEILGSSDGQ